MVRVFFVWLIAAGCAWGVDCRFSSAPRTLFSKGSANALGSKLIQVWDLDDSPLLWSRALPSSPSLAKFRAEARARVDDLAPAALLRRALEHTPPTAPEHRNLTLALRAGRRKIRPMQCWEAVLLSHQTDRLDMTATPTEFIAFFLRLGLTGALRIYFYTVNQPGIGGLGEILTYVETDLARGWSIVTNLHNHNFFFDQANVSGVTAPSGPDVGAFRSMAKGLGLREARITNGFHTIRLKRSDFARFQP